MKIKSQQTRLPGLFLILCILCVTAVFPSCREDFGIAGSGLGSLEDIPAFHRDTKSIDYSGLKFTPWDVKAASSHITKRTKKPYTIMVYMNGSSLESEAGAATDDIMEMLGSGVNADNLNLLLFTGGTNRWQNDVIPENTCAIWEIENGAITEVTRVGLVNMGDPGTLASFIDFCIGNFSADKYGLIMWDHGGGSIAGYGDDEKFNDGNLTLLDLNYAFEQSALAENSLEFLGFDSCLMGSVEMAMVASDYAKYMIASEDLEPGGGWDYSFLSALNKNPYADGATLGKDVVDYFMNYYGKNSDEILALSVIDLSKVDLIMGAMGDLMVMCSESLESGRDASFQTLAKKRNGTKTFGEGSPRDNECDMIDIGDMAYKLSDLFPKESAAILASLENAVIYNRHNSNVDLKGLSTYYIYGGKTIGQWTLNTYSSLSMNPLYTDYLKHFYSILTGKNTPRNTRSSGSASSASNATVSGTPASVHSTLSPEDIVGTTLTLWQPLEEEPEHLIMAGTLNITEMSDISDEKAANAGKNTLWPAIGGKNICLHPISQSAGREYYAIPATLNGKDCDIIVMISESCPEGKILGARNEDGIVIQKGYDPIKKGDKISFYYEQQLLDKDFNIVKAKWYQSGELTAENELQLEWLSLKGNRNYFSVHITDTRNNGYYGKLLRR